MNTPDNKTERSLEACVRLLTADCPGAVAVIELLFSEQPTDVVPFFQQFVTLSKDSFVPDQVNRIVYGRWRDEDVVAIRAAANRWEIHCHGGRAAISQIMNDLETAGGTITDSSSAVRRPDSSNEDLDDAVAERALTQALQSCRTLEAARWILNQQDGRLAILRKGLRSDNPDTRHAAWEIVRRWKDFARHLTDPFRIALMGVPNAGKSSLMNALAGKQRAIVSEIPGTTRDVLETDIVFNGWMLRLADTAGIRDSAASSIEHSGIQRAITMMNAVELVCVIIDATNPVVDEALIRQLQSITVPYILVWNKSDLLTGSETQSTEESRTNIRRLLTAARDVEVSAITGSGIEQLLAAMTETLILQEPENDCPLPLRGLWEDLAEPQSATS
ncbi:MAG: GTP-binding protein [Planctomycetaceae bacterium]|nr:GTP-binding protein [Planctomycetaceae bacterium]